MKIYNFVITEKKNSLLSDKWHFFGGVLELTANHIIWLTVLAWIMTTSAIILAMLNSLYINNAHVVFQSKGDVLFLIYLYGSCAQLTLIAFTLLLSKVLFKYIFKNLEAVK